MQLCLALRYCHSQNVLHGDVKSSNVFLTDQKDLKLGDFGTATNLAKTIKSVEKMTGTPLFFAPEIVHGEHHSFKADVWSLGVVFYHLMALKYPFYDTSFGGLLGKICDEEPAPLPSIYSQELRDFVMSFLVKKEADRPEMEDLCRSAWFINTIQTLPQENAKFSRFQPQMTIRITENFLKREFDAIRVFRFSEDQTNILKSSLGYIPAHNKSFFDIFQSNCGGDVDSRKTERLLSRFARQPDGSQLLNEISQDESQLLEDDELEFRFGLQGLKQNDKSKKSTNVTDQGVQISIVRNTAVDWKCEPVITIIKQHTSNSVTLGKCFSTGSPSLTDMNRADVKTAPCQPTKIDSERFQEHSTKKERYLNEMVPSFIGSSKTNHERENTGVIVRSEKVKPWNKIGQKPQQKTLNNHFSAKKTPKVIKQNSSENKPSDLKFNQVIEEVAAQWKPQNSKGMKSGPGSPNISSLKQLARPASNFWSQNSSKKLQTFSKPTLKTSLSAKKIIASTSNATCESSKPKDVNGEQKLTKIDSKIVEAIIDLGSIALHKRIAELKSRNTILFEYSMADEWEQNLTHCMVEKMRAALADVLVRQ